MNAAAAKAYGSTLHARGVEGAYNQRGANCDDRSRYTGEATTCFTNPPETPNSAAAADGNRAVSAPCALLFRLLLPRLSGKTLGRRSRQPVNIRDIETLYAFNRWANHRVLSDASSLTHLEFSRDLATSHASVGGTLVHILWAEWLWLRRWRGESPKQLFAPAEFSDIAGIEAEWQNVEREQRIFLTELTDERLDTRVAYQNLQGQLWEYPLGHMMQHVVNHSSYHRGQVVSLLRQLGQVPRATDFLVFLDSGGEGAA